ncbi:hypothetical protein HMPREF0058_2052, partial [Actinomyces urogenitalis DSM 15434]
MAGLAGAARGTSDADGSQRLLTPPPLLPGRGSAQAAGAGAWPGDDRRRRGRATGLALVTLQPGRGKVLGARSRDDGVDRATP